VTNPHKINSKAPLLGDYKLYFDIDTRWMDNDIYGHVNNVVYYSYFDTIVNRFLIENAGLDIRKGTEIGLMVSSQCHYYSGIAFPDKLIGAFGVNKVGNSSVEYNLAIFKENEERASAKGILTHVFVDRSTHKPLRIAGLLRQALTEAILV